MSADNEAKNHHIADVLMETIIQVHGHLRPFIVIFPEENGQVGSVTNLVAVESVTRILQSYLASLEGVEEMEMIEEGIIN